MASVLTAVQATKPWRVYLHAQVGRVLAVRIRPVGFLARALAREIPMRMHATS